MMRVKLTVSFDFGCTPSANISVWHIVDIQKNKVKMDSVKNV